MQQSKIEAVIRQAIADRNATTPEEREIVYSTSRAVLERKAGENPDMRQNLDAAIAAIEAGYAPAPKQVPPRGARKGVVFGGILVGILAGIALSGAAFWGASAANLFPAPPQPPVQTKDPSKLEQAYQASLPQVDVMVAYLEKVRLAVVDRQAKDAAKLVALSGTKFVALNQIDPDVAKAQPATLPAGTAIVVRVDAKDYKILANWTLCSTVQFSRPQMIDVIRKPVGLSCPYFGVWSSGATRW